MLHSLVSNILSAGALTVADMEALFKPVPFGHTGHQTPLAQLTELNGLPVWDLFRNIDEEKQTNTLQVRLGSPSMQPRTFQGSTS